MEHLLSIITRLCQRDSHVRGGPDFIIDDQSLWSGTIKNYFENNEPWSGRGDLWDCDSEFLVMGTMGTEIELSRLISKYTEHFLTYTTAL